MDWGMFTAGAVVGMVSVVIGVEVARLIAYSREYKRFMHETRQDSSGEAAGAVVRPRVVPEAGNRSQGKPGPLLMAQARPADPLLGYPRVWADCPFCRAESGEPHLSSCPTRLYES